MDSTSWILLIAAAFCVVALCAFGMEVFRYVSRLLRAHPAHTLDLWAYRSYRSSALFCCASAGGARICTMERSITLDEYRWCIAAAAAHAWMMSAHPLL